MFDTKSDRLKQDEILGLDLKFYRETYSDLKSLSDNGLIDHWVKFGKNEGRLGDFPMDGSFEFELDVNFYLNYYEDLHQSNITTSNEAKLHWLNYGKKEGRLRSLNEFIDKKNLYLFINPKTLNLDEIRELNKDLHVKYQDLVDFCVGKLNKLLRFSIYSTENYSLYKELGISLLIKFKETKAIQFLESARIAWNYALNFHKSKEVLELIANTYMDEEDYRIAQIFYEQALYESKIPSVGLIQSTLKCYESLLLFPKIIDFISEMIERNPKLSILYEKLDDYSEKLYKYYTGEVQSLALLNYRERLKKKTKEYTQIIYNAYYRAFSSKYGSEQKPNLKSINFDKVLIIGDYNVKQCIRYRIDQKVEQLKALGVTVTTVNWMNLRDDFNQIALHDIVIFYRTPSTPRLIKATAQLNASGKVSFYEIDDLLFDESYPAPFESFGGNISYNTYIDLVKSMGSFNAAASICTYGIASTNALCAHLSKVVSSEKCILHRNGLDRLNEFKNYSDFEDKGTIDIFYGSGTLAHNSDFEEQALGALKRILKLYPNVRLIIAGHLELPAEFKKAFKGQLKFVPKINDVQAYWSFLEKADINIAVLNDDVINGAKSELKWFEAACFGISSVLSTTENYRDLINHEVDGFLVASEDQWFDALDRLIKDPEIRIQIGKNAQKRVREEYSLTTLGESLFNDIKAIVPQPAKKKKIALVNVLFPPQSYGGATRVVSDNFDILNKQYEDDFEIVTFTSDNHCTKPYQLSTYNYDGTTVYRSSVLYRENMDWHPKDENMYDLFREFLELEKPDLVHFHCIQRLTGSVVEATMDLSIPYIVTAHDAWWISDFQFLVDQHGHVYKDGHKDIYADRALPHNVSFDESINRRRYLKNLLKNAKYTLTVSDTFAELYHKNGHEQTEVNKNGISSSIKWQKKDTSYTDKLVCGHVGNTAEHKGYNLLKEAVLESQPENLEFLVVDYSKPAGYKSKMLWGNVPVTYIAPFDQSDVNSLYGQIDVLFAPSLWPESFGLVTREASACGCWIVASSLGAIGEDVIEGENGFVIEPSLVSLNDVIEKLEKESVKYKSLAKIEEPKQTLEQVKGLILSFYKA